VAARYFARERIFVGCGQNQHFSTPVFAVDDLSADECQTLEESVQRCLEEVEQVGGGTWVFTLAPSAEDEPAGFVNLKSEWERTRKELDNYRRASGNSWQSDIAWLHGIAEEYANIIREMRSAELPTVYLQYDSGHGYETFDSVDSLTWDELDTLESVLQAQLYDMGLALRIISDWHAEREPADYVQAKLDWTRFKEELENEEAHDLTISANSASSQCIEEIKRLRSKPLVYGPDDNDEGIGEGDVGKAEVAAGPDASSNVQMPANYEPLIADEKLRAGYRDPDNYRRNVWLYEQRKAGRTNAAILADLGTKAAQFAPLESENALRAAIDSIANYHRWPILKGKAGRPRASISGAVAGKPQSDLG